MQIPPSLDPLSVLLWIVGAPSVVLLVKAVWFIADAHKDLKVVVKYVNDRRATDQYQEVHMACVEEDINTLRHKADMQPRQWPERYNGIERRA